MKRSLHARRICEPRHMTWLLLLCVLSAVLTACGNSQQANKKERPPVPVQTAGVVAKDTPLFIEAIGNVIAYNTVDVKSRVTGELVKTFFKEGDFLTKGQQLFTIDQAPFQAKVKESEAKLKQSKVQFEHAKREFLRFKALYSEKAVSQELLENKEVDMNSKLHQVELNQAELESARLNLGYCSIESPLDGEAGERYIDNFNIVNANQDKLVTIKQIRPIKVKFSVPGKFLDRIRQYSSGDPLAVEALVLGSDKPETGTLTMIDNVINLKTGMITIEGTFPNPEAQLWPGQFVRIKLRLTVTQNAILVQHRAVLDGPQGRYVWLVQPDQTVTMQPVKIDRRSGDMEVVSEGLKAGETVVTDGQLLLSPGATIVTREQMEKMRGKAPSEKAPPSDKRTNRGKDSQGS
ncbi:MAG: efflux RND transporter periplasmic adaptor subunit [Desulfomonile tiedjei]|nr:efflux RND transporter periplasmic adaptor subunit [Desulfomonile tiedjei]